MAPPPAGLGRGERAPDFVLPLQDGTPTRFYARAGGTPVDWALETHKAARTVWNLLPPSRVLEDDYFQKVLPTLDRQLGLAGLRLARFLNEAYGSKACPARY